MAALGGSLERRGMQCVHNSVSASLRWRWLLPSCWRSVEPRLHLRSRLPGRKHLQCKGLPGLSGAGSRLCSGFRAALAGGLASMQFGRKKGAAWIPMESRGPALMTSSSPPALQDPAIPEFEEIESAGEGVLGALSVLYFQGSGKFYMRCKIHLASPLTFL